MSKCDFNKVALQLVNLLHIFRTPFLKNTYGRLLLYKEWFIIYENKVISFTLEVVVKTTKKPSILECYLMKKHKAI